MSFAPPSTAVTSNSTRPLISAWLRSSSVPPKKLVERIREAIAIDQRARAVATERTAVVDRIARLTPRERQVMDLLAMAQASKEIAAKLKISLRTVEGHRRAVLRKMGVSSAAELARAVARLE